MSEMRSSATVLILVLLTGLSGCGPEANPSNPPVERSTVMIEIAKRGEMQTSTSLLKDVVYVEMPSDFCVSNTDKTLFLVDADERGAVQVKVHLGQCAGKYAEVRGRWTKTRRS